MNKRFLSVILSLILIFSLAVCFTASAEESHIHDSANKLDSEKISSLNALAQAVYLSKGVQVHIIITLENEENKLIAEAAYDEYCAEEPAIMLVDNFGTGYVYMNAMGGAEDIISNEDLDTVLNSYLNQQDLNTACILFISSVDTIIAENTSEQVVDPDEETVTPSVTEDVTEEEQTEAADVTEEQTGAAAVPEEKESKATAPRVTDGADLLSDEQEAELIKRLDALSEELELDVVVVTAETLGSKQSNDYAYDFYEEYSFGFGEEYDGTILLFCPEYGDYYHATCGYAITAINDAGIEYCKDAFVPELQEGDYYGAFLAFADSVEYLVSSARQGEIYEGESDAALYFLVAIVVGLIAASVHVGALKSKLKTVNKKQNAADYQVPGTFRVNNAYEQFLYTNVIRKEKPKESSKSTTDTSSSGRTYGGGGGRI